MDSLAPAPDVFERLDQYRICALVDKYRGRQTFGTVMAIIEHESNFYPNIYNWLVYDEPGHTVHKDAHGQVVVGGRDYAAPGSGAWGGGYFKHDPHAIGLGQVLDSLRGPHDYDVAQTAELLDPETNIRAFCTVNLRRLAWLEKQLGQGLPPAVEPLATYLLHAEGPGGTLPALRWMQAQGVLDLAGYRQWPGKTVNRKAGFLTVAQRSTVWQAGEGNLFKLQQTPPANEVAHDESDLDTSEEPTQP